MEINKPDFKFKDVGGRFNEYTQRLEAISKRKKLEISTQNDASGRPKAITAKVSDLTDDKFERTPTKNAAYLKADYNTVDGRSFLSAISRVIGAFKYEKSKNPEKDIHYAHMNDGITRGISQEQFDSVNFNFSDLTQKFL